MESLPQVEAGVVGLHKSSRLVAFVVPKIYTRTMSSEHSSNQEQHMHSSSNDTENSHVSSRAVEMEVLKGLSQLVPSHSVPDSLLLIPALPLTNHGTVFYSPLCVNHNIILLKHASWRKTLTCCRTFCCNKLWLCALVPVKMKNSSTKISLILVWNCVIVR